MGTSRTERKRNRNSTACDGDGARMWLSTAQLSTANRMTAMSTPGALESALGIGPQRPVALVLLSPTAQQVQAAYSLDAYLPSLPVTGFLIALRNAYVLSASHPHTCLALLL